MDKFGLESAVKVHEAGIKVKRDKIAIILHWCLLRKGLLFSGLGTNFSEEDGKLSEVLPADWSESDFTWKYRERNNTPNKFILNISQVDEILNVTLVRLSDEISKDLSVDLKKEVFNDTQSESGEKFHLVGEDNFIQKAFSALLKDFFPDPEPPKPAERENSPLRSTRPRTSRGRSDSTEGSGEVPRIGGQDLDPFGGFGGGGMMMDPQRIGRPNPPGMGPRFDPVYPGMPNPGMGQHPDPFGPRGPRGGRGGPSRGGGRNYGDEMPPPGYDDMFM